MTSQPEKSPCLACDVPTSDEFHTCGIARAFPAEANTLVSRRSDLNQFVRRQVMEHYFGPSDGPPALGERLCNEPEIPGSTIHRIYHVHFDHLANGNFRCKHCSEMFIEET